MKLFLVGANSPTGKGLIEILRKNKIRFLAPADKNFDLVDGGSISKLVADFAPTQLVNMADFISRNHNALKRAESSEQRCERINALLPASLAQTCSQLDIPMLHLSNSYVFDGEKKLGYNENDETNPKGVYGYYTLAGEQAVRNNPKHIIMRSGWLFGKHKIGLVKSWINSIKKHNGELTVSRRRFSPTSTADLASAILAVTQQVDCDVNVWGTYHYSGLETKKEIEFLRQVLKYAANHDEEIYQLLDNTKIREKLPRLPELPNSTLSSKKIFDTFGIKQKSWHGDLQESIKTLYIDRLRNQPEQSLANELSS